jgi:hypothetical protein
MNNPPWCLSITSMNNTIQQVPSDAQATVKVKVTIMSKTYAHVLNQCKAESYATPAQYIAGLVRRDYQQQKASQHA